MSPLQIEQLVNDYLDRELPENQAALVEELLRTDPEAKRIHDEILALRDAIRSLPSQKLPAKFQQELFRKIDDLPVKPAAVPQKWYSSGSLKKRLANPRVWTFPLIVLLVASVIFLHDRSQNNQDRKTHIAVNPPVEETDDDPKSGYIFHPPLARETPLSDGTQPALKSSVIEISCRLTEDAKKNQYLRRLFADRNIVSVTRTSGISANTIYEVEVTLEQLKTLLETMHGNNESVLEILVPYDFAALLAGDQESDTLHKVRFVIKSKL